MKDGFVTYQRFTNSADMQPVADFLQKKGIESYQEDLSGKFNIGFDDNEFGKDISLKIKATDFKKADEALLLYYAAEFDNFPADYYLFSFSDEELKKILRTRDEWGLMDFLLAQRILKERKVNIPEDYLNKLHTKRIVELSTAEHASPELLSAAYSFTLTIIGGFIYAFILLGKKTLPDGTGINAYDRPSRRHGYVLLAISIVFTIAGFIYYLNNKQIPW